MISNCPFIRLCKSSSKLRVHHRSPRLTSCSASGVKSPDRFLKCLYTSTQYNVAMVCVNAPTNSAGQLFTLLSFNYTPCAPMFVNRLAFERHLDALPFITRLPRDQSVKRACKPRAWLPSNVRHCVL